MISRAFLGIDVGSASVRAGIFDAEAHRLAFAVRPIKQFHPRPLFVEQSSTDIWPQTRAAVCEAVGVDATCSWVAVDKDGQGISVAENDTIIWMDHHAATQTAAINATKYAVYQKLYQDMERCRSAMAAWQ